MLDTRQQERLHIMSEECGEVVQIIGKINRHGIHSHHPSTGEKNRDLLREEVIDTMAAIQMLVETGVIDAIGNWDIQDAIQRKQQYMHNP